MSYSHFDDIYFEIDNEASTKTYYWTLYCRNNISPRIAKFMHSHVRHHLDYGALVFENVQFLPDKCTPLKCGAWDDWVT